MKALDVCKILALPSSRVTFKLPAARKKKCCKQVEMASQSELQRERAMDRHQNDNEFGDDIGIGPPRNTLGAFGETGAGPIESCGQPTPRV